MRNMNVAMLVIVVCIAANSAHAAVAAANLATPSTLTVTLIDCPENAGKKTPLRVELFDTTTRKLQEEKNGSPTVDRIKQKTMTLPADAFDVDAGSADCNQRGVIQMLPGEVENITLIAKPLAILSGPPTSIAGTIPIRGFRVSIVYKHLPRVPDGCGSPDGFVEIPAIVDGNVYYAGQVPLGEATIRLYDAARTYWIDAAVVRVQYKNRSQRNVVKNITRSDIFSGNAAIK